MAVVSPVAFTLLDFLHAVNFHGSIGNYIVIPGKNFMLRPEFTKWFWNVYRV